MLEFVLIDQDLIIGCGPMTRGHDISCPEVIEKQTWKHMIFFSNIAKLGMMWKPMSGSYMITSVCS